MDARTSKALVDDWLDLYRTIAPDSEMTPDEVELEVRDYAGLGEGEPTSDQDRAEYVADLLVAEELERRERTGWTLLATDIYGLPWYDEPEPRESHGTWARHDVCGKVQKLNPARGRTECQDCLPDPESRTHRARAGDRYLLYLVRQGAIQKFGRGYEARVREHRNGGAEIMQVIEPSHTEVVAAELALKRRYARRLRVPRRRQLPKSFGAGTEVLPGSIAIDLTAVLPGLDVTSRFAQR